ncbi:MULTISPECIES: hypothetical protein [Mycetohabitans]|uniref:hypothetical protein n=1 Tax=Mycetohabitans TaxID=2571159 RepID=UPI001F22A052|nr:hypothetical protein [Mycetohabitans sp. B3]
MAAAREAAAHAERTRLQELEPALAVAEAARQTLHTEVERLQRDAQALAQAGADFARELDKLRADTARAEARLQAAEKRALLETEHERHTSARLIKERDAAVRRDDERDAQRRAEQQALQAQLGDARQQIGMLEGSLAALQRVNADAEKRGVCGSAHPPSPHRAAPPVRLGGNARSRVRSKRLRDAVTDIRFLYKGSCGRRPFSKHSSAYSRSRQAANHHLRRALSLQMQKNTLELPGQRESGGARVIYCRMVKFGYLRSMPRTNKELIERDNTRHIGTELLCQAKFDQ